MKRVLCACAAVAALGLAAEGIREPWRDPTVNSINRLEARAIVVPCESEAVALAIAKGEKPREASQWLVSLNGVWNFRWKANFGDDWAKTGTIAVPGCWQLQGDYDPALYTNTTYPIAGYKTGDPTLEPPKHYTSSKYRTPVGLYSRPISIPPEWKGRRIVIHFGGVSSAMFVRLNGKDVGYSEDSRLPAEFDLTPHLREGANELEVEVLKHCDGSYLEDQDFWRLSGIYRDVWLVAEQPAAAKDIVVRTALSDDYSRGTIEIFSEKGQTLLKKTYDNPKLWSAEFPNLYYETFVSAGDFYAVQTGFRKIEIRDSVVYLNGKRLVVAGTNRHEMEPDRGYAVTLAGMKRDIAIFKRLNINAVRTSHYPNDPLWYELCDRAGIYVCSEANVEAHGVEGFYGKGDNHLPKNPLYRGAIVERGVNMVKVLRNHPSIVFWSLGNESGSGEAMREEYRAMRALDATRPIQYEGMQDSDVSDIKCPMYARPWQVEQYVRNNPRKPYILCEYTHAMGNSNGDIQDYWNLVSKYPSAQGGFIWDFADQALWRNVPGGKVLAYGGDFGDQPNDDNFNCNGFVTADRDFHPGAWEIKHAYQSIHVESYDWDAKKAKIRNSWLFTPLDGIRGEWKVEKQGERVASGKIDLAGFAPDSSREIGLDAPDGDAIAFFFYRPGCDEPIAHDQFAKPFAPLAVPDEPSTREKVSHLFRLNLSRAQTDNDRGWQMGKRCKIWREATDDKSLPEGCVSKFDARKLRGNRILVDWSFTVPKGLPPIPRVGVSFQIPADCKTVRWFGLGPWENYCDRDTAALLGVHEATIGLVSGVAGADGKIAADPARLNPDNYIEPGEQGYRTGCRWIEFANDKGKKITVTALNAPVGFNAWPYSQDALESARHQFDLKTADTITVNVDAAQMGVGGDNSWGAEPHGNRMLGAGVYKLQFIVEGL
ncbi:MAG: glycoside hydrolase family 2 TIM barrel-domain containing protein [Kiritimatiellia bacterium]